MSDTGSRMAWTDPENRNPNCVSKDMQKPTDATIFEELEQESELQLIHLNESRSSEQAAVIINKCNLKVLLESTDDRQICLISVIGPRRTGKTLLLNYIKLHLEAFEKGDKDFNLENITYDVTGFRWDAKSDSGTTGIFAWNRAFLIDTQKTELAVILLDTQEFANEASNPEWLSCALGLSFLFSSITIYNVKRDLNIQDLSVLAEYFKFGTISRDADKGVSDEPPFQKLSFLVRDWNGSNDVKYGKDGGKLLLKARENALKRSAEMQGISSFRKMFKKVETFLLPNIGQMAFDKSFTGRVDELNSEFLTYLKIYIGNLLNDVDVYDKKVFGVSLTADNLADLFDAYVQMFNESIISNVPITDKVMFKTCSNTHHQSIINKATQRCIEFLEKRSSNRVYLGEADLESAQSKGKALAMTIFHGSKILPEFETDFELALKRELDDVCRKFEEENTSSRSTYRTGCMQVAGEEYRNKLMALLPTNAPSITIYKEAFLHQYSEKEKEYATNRFLSKFPDEKEESVRNLKQSLHDYLLKVYQPFLETNKRNQAEAEKILMQSVSIRFESYKGTMIDFIDRNPYVEVKILQQFHVQSKEKELKQYEESNFRLNVEIIAQYKQILDTKMEEKHATLSKAQTDQIRKKMDEAASLLQTQAEAYTFSLQKKAKELSSLEDLETIHKQAVVNIVKSFKEVNPFPEDALQHGLLVTRLEDQLQIGFGIVKKEVFEQKFKTAVEKSFRIYKCGFEENKRRSEFIQNAQLFTLHTALSNQSIASFQEIVSNDQSELGLTYKAKLEKLITEERKRFKTTNDTAIQLVKSQAKNWKTECLKEYQSMMKVPSNVCEREEDLKREHEDAVNETNKSFKSKWSYRSKGFQDDYLEELIKEINETFEELLEMFAERQRTDDAKTTASKETVRSYYHKEMEKHFKNCLLFIQPSELDKLHTSISDAALKYCTSKTPMKESQVNILRQALEKSFRNYKDRNYMTLNWTSVEGTGLDKNPPAIGIDLGTTYCCVAVFVKGKTIVVPNAEGRTTTPSYVAFNEDGSQTIGRTAKNNAFSNPENTVYDAKRIIGRSINETSLADDMRFWPFKVKDGDEGPVIEINHNQYPPEQIAALLLRKLAAQASNRLGFTVKKAVITVPAYFTDGQRAATFDAGEIAGLEVLQIIDEPTAAALAYKLERLHEDAKKVVIFDLGGGTFDISILEIDSEKIRVLNKDGDTHLGGEDFDKIMMEYCANVFKNDHGIDPFGYQESDQIPEKDATKQRLRRLQSYCEKAKIDLGSSPLTVIAVDAFIGNIDLKVTVTRQKFEELNSAHFTKTIEILDRALKQINLSRETIDDVVLVGGSTRIPKVQQLLKEYFNGKALSHSVHPDEAVAYGAAVQAALLNGHGTREPLSYVTIEDVTPMSLGIEATVGGISGQFSRIIPKNTKIPTICNHIYSTLKKNQQTASIKIYQGESIIAKENKLLGQFVLGGIPPAPAGDELIDVKMTIDQMGILHITAYCRSSNSQESLTVEETRAGRLSRSTKKRLLEVVATVQSN